MMKSISLRWLVPCLSLALLPALRAQLPAAAPAAVDTSVFKDPKAPVEKRVEALFAQMTIAEKFTLIAGSSRVMGMQPVPRLGIPEFLMTDAGMGGVEHGPSTAYPGGMGLASTWDVEQARRDGDSQARDTRARGEQIILGPAMDLYRAPICGRNFEYFGEDPLLAGYIAAAYVKGAQSQGIGVACKHFAANDQEPGRDWLSSNVDERTLRELDLKPFEICVKAGALGFMCSYNPLNGVYTSENKWLLTDILKEEWGFKGLVMSDWGACHATAADINAGLDLEEPHGQWYTPAKLQQALDSGAIKQASIDDHVRRILRVAFTLGWFDRQLTDSSIPKDDPASCAVALQGAREGVTLLKNTGNLLPANPAAVKRVVVLGPNADPAMYGGGGSSHVGVFHSVSVDAGIKNLLGANAEVTHVPYQGQKGGGRKNNKGATPTATPDPLASTASALPGISPEFTNQVKNADLAVICVGYNGQQNAYEGEGNDRSYTLPAGQEDLIRSVTSLNPQHTVVIVNAGGSVSTSGWLDKVPVFIDAFYPGQEGGTAIAEILFGKVNPSGRLCFTWDKKWEDIPSFGNYPNPVPKVKSSAYKDGVFYKEGVFAGYRGYDAKNIEPLFPFGFGLSYTSFEFSDVKVSEPDANGNITVTTTIKNTGKVAGAEVAQLYVQPPAVQPQAVVPPPVRTPGDGAPPADATPVVVTRPIRELKGFTRVELAPGESKTATITLTRSDLAYWDPNSRQWTVTPGGYVFSVGSSSRDLPVHADVKL